MAVDAPAPRAKAASSNAMNLDAPKGAHKGPSADKAKGSGDAFDQGQKNLSEALEAMAEMAALVDQILSPEGKRQPRTSLSVEGHEEERVNAYHEMLEMRSRRYRQTRRTESAQDPRRGQRAEDEDEFKRRRKKKDRDGRKKKRHERQIIGLSGEHEHPQTPFREQGAHGETGVVITD